MAGSGEKGISRQTNSITLVACGVMYSPACWLDSEPGIVAKRDITLLINYKRGPFNSEGTISVASILMLCSCCDTEFLFNIAK